MRRVSFFCPIVSTFLALWLLPAVGWAQGTIEGTVTFWGDPGGGTQIEIAAMPDNWSGPAATVLVGLNDSFSLPVPDGSYYVWAYMDRDGGFGDADDEDVIVYYDADGDGAWDMVPVTGGATTGIDIDLGFVYVDIDATGANDGTTWSNAFTDLQDGIDLAVSGIEVWVAEGTYVPGTSRSDSFLPKAGVRVCGGFTGSETMRIQRDWNAHPTILSCEIGAAAATDNCYHVIRAETANPYAVFDGVTITRGYANGGTIEDYGGGVRARGGGVTLANVTVIDNYAQAAGGGAMANLGGTIKAYNTSFVNNRAPYFEGGAYYGSVASAQPQTLVNCVFANNSAWRGGGIALTSSGLQPELVNLTLSGNTASGEGGGIYVNAPTIQFVIHNSILWGNTGPNPQISAYAGVNWPEVNHSIVQGGWTHGGTHILDVDPSFADAELRLNLDSPAIDAGDNTAVAIDLHDADGNHWTDEPIHADRDFNQRFRNLPYIPNTGVAAPGEWPVDMGAYEAWDPTVIFEHDFEGGGLDPWSNVVGAI